MFGTHTRPFLLRLEPKRYREKNALRELVIAHFNESRRVDGGLDLTRDIIVKDKPEWVGGRRPPQGPGRDVFP